jgi:hypothetical protein
MSLDHDHNSTGPRGSQGACACACGMSRQQHGGTKRMRLQTPGWKLVGDSCHRHERDRHVGIWDRTNSEVAAGSSAWGQEKPERSVASEACHPGATEAEPRQSTNVALEVLHSCDRLACRSDNHQCRARGPPCAIFLLKKHVWR